MAAEQKKLYRTRDGLIAGVCGGIARYFDIDVGVLRLFSVLFAVLTCGVLVLIYLALWLIVPLEPVHAATVDVAPESIASEVYDQVVNAGAGKNAAQGPSGIGSGHMPPPRPPEAARSAGKSAYAAYPPAASPYAPSSATPASPAPSANDAKKAASTGKSYVPRTAKWGLIGGVVLVTIGIAVLFSNWVHVFSPVQFWPLLLVAGGIVRMVIPDEDGYHLGDLLLGMFLFVAGAMLLMQTLGVLLYDGNAWMDEAWPLLALAAGTLILGHAYDSPALLLTGVIIVLLFCLLGLVVYSVPGPAQSVWVPLPFDQGLSMDWRS